MTDQIVYDWNAADYGEHGSFVSELGRPLIGFLNLRPGMRVLDIGCGDGSLSKEIAAMGVDVVGIDTSPDMVRTAKANGIDARRVDAQHMNFSNEFDAAFSNASLHWMARDPQAVLDGTFEALKPGGRFVAEMGSKGNVQHIADALTEALRHAGLDPDFETHWYFPSQEDYMARLIRAGFTIDFIEAFERPTPLPTGIESWLSLFARPMLMRLPEESRPSSIKRIVNFLEPYLRDQHGHWFVDYVRLRFAVHRP